MSGRFNVSRVHVLYESVLGATFIYCLNQCSCRGVLYESVLIRATFPASACVWTYSTKGNFTGYQSIYFKNYRQTLPCPPATSVHGRQAQDNKLIITHPGKPNTRVLVPAKSHFCMHVLEHGIPYQTSGKTIMVIHN